MGASEWVVRHSKAVIAVWVIALVLSVPLALSLDKVLVYEEQQFLPSNVESIKADDIMKEKFGQSTLGGNQTILLITGIDAGSSEAKQAYMSLKDKVVGEYAANMTSYYDVIDSLDSTSTEVAINITKMIANLSAMLMNSSKAMNESFYYVLEGLNGTAKAVNFTKESLVRMAQAYLQARQNLTNAYERLMELKQVINQTDAAYVETVRNLTAVAQMLNQMKEAIATTNEALYGTRDAFAHTYFDVTRTYYFLQTSTNAYVNGVLTPADVYAVIQATNTSGVGPVPPELIYVVFNATYPLVQIAGPDAVNDAVLANITAGIVKAGMASVQQDMTAEEAAFAEQLLEAYSAVFTHAVAAFDSAQGSEEAVVWSYGIVTQDEVYVVVNSIADQALTSLPDAVLASGIAPQMPGYPEMSAKDFANLLEAAITLGRNPTEQELTDVTVAVAMQMMSGQETPLAVMPNAPDVVKALLTQGVTKELVKELLIQGIQQYTTDEVPQGLVAAVVETVMALDPNATQTVSRNSSLLEAATISIAAEMMNTQESSGVSAIDQEVLRALYESGGSAESIDAIAKDLIRRFATEQATKVINATELPVDFNITEMIEAITEAATTDPNGIIDGTGLRKATVNVILNLSKESNPDFEDYLPDGVTLKSVIEEVYDAVESDGDVRPIAEELFMKGVNQHIDEVVANLTRNGIPEEISKKIKDVTLTLAEEIVRKAPCSENVLEKLVKDQVTSLVSDFIKTDERARLLADNIDTNELVEIAFKYRDDPDAIDVEAVKPIASEILREMLDYADTYLSMLKSDDNTTIAVLVTLKGSTDEERYKNALNVRDFATNEFSKHFPNVKAYVTGELVGKEELKSYGERDVSTVNKVSIIGALIVLFIVVGGIAATIMPFVSVGTAIMGASAIIYILAANFMDITSWARVLMTTTALGLGIDYSTYYLYRYREYLTEGIEHRKAAAEALRRAFDAVMASALTDIIAFASFMIAWDFPFLRVMGVVVPIAVVAVLLASLTLVPALTAEFGKGKAFWWPRVPKLETTKKEVSKVVSKVTKWAPVVVALAVVLGAPATYAYVTFSGSHDINLYLPEGSQTAAAMTLMQDKFGASLTSPTYIVLELRQPFSNSTLPVIEEICIKLSELDGVKAVYSPTRPFGEKLSNLTMNEVELFNGTMYVSDDNTTVLIKLTLKYPAETDEARNLVKEIRDLLTGLTEQNKDTISKAYVGGLAAMNLDLDIMINEDFWHKIFPVAIVLMFLSLLPTLKGLPAAAATMTTIYLGTVWSIWLSTNLFHQLFGIPMLWFLPMVVLIILMGVGIDYNSFYLVRARDEYEKRSPKEALAVAAASADNVVIGLSAILATTYASLMLTTMWAMKEMGFTLALGIMLVSISAVYFVSPALMALCGKYAWWPWRKARANKKTK